MARTGCEHRNSMQTPLREVRRMSQCIILLWLLWQISYHSSPVQGFIFVLCLCKDHRTKRWIHAKFYQHSTTETTETRNKSWYLRLYVGAVLSASVYLVFAFHSTDCCSALYGVVCATGRKASSHPTNNILRGCVHFIFTRPHCSYHAYNVT
jgi:hypothetical protein